jgi:hypothetical protein
MAAAAPGGTFHSQMHFSAISVSQYVSIAGSRQAAYRSEKFHTIAPDICRDPNSKAPGATAKIDRQ